MFDSNRQQITFILYDGIENSVFESQVLAPLISHIEQSPHLEIILISFEKTRPRNYILTSKIPAHDRLHLVICRRLPFLGKWSLFFAIFQLKQLLNIIPSHRIIARGPLAGYVARKAIAQWSKKNYAQMNASNNIYFSELTIQARGLCAEECRYVSENFQQSLLDKIKNKIVYKALKKIECEVYCNNPHPDYPCKITIESVSLALKEYLVGHFHADSTKITIATRDLPKSIARAQVIQWHNDVRRELGINNDAIVYCYSGSFKAWQCAQETIAAFAYEYSKNQQCFMLILSQDKEPFFFELNRYKIPSTCYKVITVRPADLYRYLSAGNFGMLLRKHNIINWVSRPTKMLEYQAVGLKIIHNNTIAWLAGS
jgi:hypothetical protein